MALKAPRSLLLLYLRPAGIIVSRHLGSAANLQIPASNLALSGLPARQEAWIKPSLASGWSDFDAGNNGNTLYGYLQYMKDSLGFVHLRGLVKNTSGSTKAIGSLIATLPAGYRPANEMLSRHVIAISDVLGQLNVRTDGGLELTGTKTVANTEWVSLNGIVFKADA